MPPRAESEVSAGGVVLRGEDVAVIVPKRLAADGALVLGLPKGHPDGEETLEQAATREVREETGLDAELVEKLGDVRYVYRRDGRMVRKSVAFFLFRHRSGSLDDHDHEIIEARWMPLEEARSALSYPGEREMAERALSRLRSAR
jgi:8-oxo-dGTP pyrophosphatase MutT (NUDIX family)